MQWILFAVGIVFGIIGANSKSMRSIVFIVLALSFAVVATVVHVIRIAPTVSTPPTTRLAEAVDSTTMEDVEDDFRVIEVQTVPGLVSVRRVKVESIQRPGRILFALTDTESLAKSGTGRVRAFLAPANAHNLSSSFTHLFFPME